MTMTKRSGWIVGFSGRESRRLRVLCTAAGLAALTLVAANSVRAALQAVRAGHASDSATILAFAGVREFAERLDPDVLMQIPLGADSMVMKARVFAGDQSMGTYAVNVAHVGPSAFRLRSTGRLVDSGRSTMCSLDVFVQVSTTEARPSLGVEQEPLCNGLRHESAVTRVRTIGS
jgi:Family of unknown function (DUF6023)